MGHTHARPLNADVSHVGSSWRNSRWAPGPALSAEVTLGWSNLSDTSAPKTIRIAVLYNSETKNLV